MGFSVQEFKIDFQDGNLGSNLVFLTGTILYIFYLQVILMLFNKFRVNWAMGSAEEAKNRFSRWTPWQPSCISSQNHFSFFGSTRHPDASYQVSDQLAFSFSRRSEKQIFNFKHGSHLRFSTHNNSSYLLSFWFRRSEKQILAFFDLQVTMMLPTKFQVYWPFDSGEEAKNKYSKW